MLEGSLLLDPMLRMLFVVSRRSFPNGSQFLVHFCWAFRCQGLNFYWMVFRSPKILPEPDLFPKKKHRQNEHFFHETAPVIGQDWQKNL